MGFDLPFVLCAVGVGCQLASYILTVLSEQTTTLNTTQPLSDDVETIDLNK